MYLPIYLSLMVLSARASPRRCVPIPGGMKFIKPINIVTETVSKGLVCTQAMRMPTDYCGKQTWTLKTYKGDGSFLTASSHSLGAAIGETVIIGPVPGPLHSETRDEHHHFIDPGRFPDIFMQACAYMDEPGYLSVKVVYFTE